MRCTLTRWAISKAADGHDLSARAARHIERCSSCSAFETRVLELGSQLAAAPVAPSPSRPRPKRNRLAWGAGFAAGIVGAAIIAQTLGPSEAPKPRQALATNDQSSAPARAAAATALSDSELSALKTDARAGVQYFLRVSGLPNR